MLNEKTKPYFKTVTSLSIPLKERMVVVAAAVASGIAEKLSVPADAVASPESFFNSTHAVSTNTAIGEYNNAAVLDYDLAKEMVRKFWVLRYNALHGKRIVVFRKGCFSSCFSGIDAMFSPEEIKIFEEYSVEFGMVRSVVMDTCDC